MTADEGLTAEFAVATDFSGVFAACSVHHERGAGAEPSVENVEVPPYFARPSYVKFA